MSNFQIFFSLSHARVILISSLSKFTISHSHYDFDSADPSSMQDACQIWAQLNEPYSPTDEAGALSTALRGPDVQEVIGSIPVRDSIFSFVPRSCWLAHFSDFIHQNTESCLCLLPYIWRSNKICFKLPMKWNIICAYLKGLSKYRRMAFFLLKELFRFRDIDIFLLCKLDQWWRHTVCN